MRSLLPAVILAASLGACASVADTAHDYYGNTYPADCGPEIVRDPALLAHVVIVRGDISGVYGTTFRRIGDKAVVVLSSRLSGWMLADVTRHELCHAKHMLDGNADGGDWHAHYVPNVYRAPSCANPFHC